MLREIISLMYLLLGPALKGQQAQVPSDQEKSLLIVKSEGCKASSNLSYYFHLLEQKSTTQDDVQHCVNQRHGRTNRQGASTALLSLYKLSLLIYSIWWPAGSCYTLLLPGSSEQSAVHKPKPEVTSKQIAKIRSSSEGKIQTIYHAWIRKLKVILRVCVCKTPNCNLLEHKEVEVLYKIGMKQLKISSASVRPHLSPG